MRSRSHSDPIRTHRGVARSTVGIVLAAGLLFAVAAAAVVPGQTSDQGLLRDAGGQPVNGVVDIELRLFDVDVSGSALWTETHLGVQVVDRLYDVVLGETTPLTSALLSSGTLYLETVVEGETLSPRRPLLAVPFAIRAETAENANQIGGLSSDVVAQIYEYFPFDGGDPPNQEPSEGLVDTDGDGVANFLDADNDDDGLSDSFEIAQGSDINLVTPTITSTTPATLTVYDTATPLNLTVHGTGFEPGLVFQIGGQNQSTTSITPTSFDALVNAKPAGAAAMTVTLPNAESVASSITFDYPTPTISSVVPAFLPTDTPTLVTINGTDFFPGLTVTFGSQTPAVQNLTATSFQVLVESSIGGTVQIAVFLANGQGSIWNTFYFLGKYAFVTSTSYDGNLGGIAGADAKCAQAAANASLPGTYYAWISDGVTSPTDRFKKANSYRRVDEVVIAQDFADLVDGSLAAPLDIDELGAGGGSVNVWSNVAGSGANGGGTASSSDCLDWSTTGAVGGVGNTGQTTGSWSDWSVESCVNLRPLYCFQQ